MSRPAKKRAPAAPRPRKGHEHATTRSTGGAGFAFEDQVGAWLLLRMLSGEAMPGMDGKFGTRLQAQTSALGWLIDDLLVTCNQAPDESHLAASCKSNSQVTSSGLPDDFVGAAWKQYATSAAGPMCRDRDSLALVTRGRHDTFQATWADIKNACTGSDTALAIARIRKTQKHRTVFENIKKVVQQSSAVDDEEIVAFIRRLLVIPTDYDLDPSQDREAAIAQCRRILASSAPDDARTFWDSLVDHVRKARLGNGTIDLPHLWHELRSRFKLTEHPDFSSGWAALRALTREYLDKIEAKLPSGHSLERSQDSGNLVQTMAKNALTVLYGESGTGKSALAKSTLERAFPEACQVWLGPDTLEATLSEVARVKIGLAHPLSTTLAATARPVNIVVLDATERVSSDSAPQIRQLIQELLSAPAPGEPAAWRILIIGQTEAWIDGRLRRLLGTASHAPVALETVSQAEVRDALRATPQLSWLALQDDAVAVLTNLRALAWVVQAAPQFQQPGGMTRFSLTAIADLLWKFWTGGQLVLQGVLMRFGQRQASFQHSVALSELPPAEALALQDRPPQLPLRITTQNRVEFQHDLAAEWARFQHLKEIADDTDRWAILAENPLWTGALRMLGQYLLRERLDSETAWDIALGKLTSAQANPGLAVDILLDALCLDPLAEAFLAERLELLLANHGALLNRLLRRFHHIATVPSGQPIGVPADPSLSLHIEAQYRTPLFARWPSVVRFLAAHKDRVAALMSPVVAQLCERWLTTMPTELGPGAPMPFRKELAELALATARSLQVGQGKGIIFGDDSEKPIYSAALSGVPDIPDEVSEWALEMAQRKEWHPEVIAQIAEHHEEQARERAERLRTDPMYRMRQERLARAATIMPSKRELPPWPLGPNERVEKDFRECCTGSPALIPLMRSRPAVAAEVLLATIIEDSPEEEYGVSYRFDEQFGLEYDRHSYPTAYWKSPFYPFLQVNPDVALGALIALVDFCTERWGHEMQRHGNERVGIALTLQNGTRKEFVGNYAVFDWGGENSTSAGQLHSALSALEKWLCVSIESGADVSFHIERLLGASHSVAVLGVLSNVGKFRPALLQGLLRPLLAERCLYVWDKHRLDAMQYRFDAGAWARQGEIIFQAARAWHTVPYRSVMLRQLAGSLVAFHSDIADFLASAIQQWDAPQGEKAALEFRMLKAELDRDNYTEVRDAATGQAVVQFTYPEALQREVAEYQRSVAPVMHALTLPMQCTNLLSSPGELTAAQAEELARVLKQATPETNANLGDEERNIARVAAAGTLLARARPWLDAHHEVREIARRAVQTVVNRIADDTDLLSDRMSGDRGELEFAAHAVMAEFVSTDGPSPHAGAALLRVLTSGNQSATRTLTSLAYQHRNVLGPAWWRILELTVLWCGLVILAPRSAESQSLRRRWTRWLRWLRSRNLTGTDANLGRINPLAIARRMERLERRRWVKEFTRQYERFGGTPPERRSLGLDTHLLKAAFGWLFQESPAATRQLDAADAGNRFRLLKALLDFELWPHTGHQEDDREELPTEIGYELLPVIVKLIPGLPAKTAAELWQPVFELGGNGHYIVGHFIEWWFQQVPDTPHIAAFCSHWRAMIECALASPQWGSGRRWFHGERLTCRILGCGSEPWLDQVSEIQGAVQQMRDLYEAWADKHLAREEDNVAYFCGFLSSSTGHRLRLDGIQWLHRALAEETSIHWRRSGTASAMTNLLDVILTEDSDGLTKNVPARNAFLGLVAILVKAQAPSALALQERARTRLARDRPSSEG